MIYDHCHLIVSNLHLVSINLFNPLYSCSVPWKFPTWNIPLPNFAWTVSGNRLKFSFPATLFRCDKEA